MRGWGGGCIQRLEGGREGPPPHWRDWHTLIEKMREGRDAPVDMMGAECCYDGDAPMRVKMFQLLISAMLSSQTKDEVTHAAMLRLRRSGCTVEQIHAMEECALADMIRPVGFYNTKAKNIKRAAALLLDR